MQWCFKHFLDHSLSNSNRLVSVVFREACHLAGFNVMYGDTFGKQYSDLNWLCADIICHFWCRPQSIQLLRSEQIQISEMLYTVATAWSFLCYICYPSIVFVSYFCTPSVVCSQKNQKTLCTIGMRWWLLLCIYIGKNFFCLHTYCMYVNSKSCSLCIYIIPVIIWCRLYILCFDLC